MENTKGILKILKKYSFYPIFQVIMVIDQQLYMQTLNNQRSHSKKCIESNEWFLTFFHVYIIPNENRNIITF